MTAYLEIERALLIRIDGKVDEVKSLIGSFTEEQLMMLHESTEPQTMEVGDYTLTKKSSSSDKLGFTINSRSRYKNLSAHFLERYLIYRSKAELSIELRLPKLISEFPVKLSLFFNHPEYSIENVEVLPCDPRLVTCYEIVARTPMET